MWSARAGGFENSASIELAGHEHLAIKAVAHRLQLGRKHGAQPGRSELADGFSGWICPRLLELEDVGQRDDI
jgi:hypothetical protein